MNHPENLDAERCRSVSIAAPPPRRQGTGEIILAEDDEAFRHLMAEVLRRDGHEVIEADNGDRLLEMIREGLDDGIPIHRPDLIISDIRMFGASGLDALEVLRQRDWMTPMILMTAFGSPEVHEKGRRLGAAAVFDKPFPLEDLRLFVRSLLRDRRDDDGGMSLMVAELGD